MRGGLSSGVGGVGENIWILEAHLSSCLCGHDVDSCCGNCDGVYGLVIQAHRRQVFSVGVGVINIVIVVVNKR